MTQLLYARDDDGASLVFVERQRALELLAAPAALTACATWGDVRSAVPAPLFAELIDELVAPVDQPPADAAPFQFDTLVSWPRISQQTLEGVIPADILQTFGERYDSMLASGWSIPAELEEEILYALASRGVTCEYDERVAELFDAWD